MQYIYTEYSTEENAMDWKKYVQILIIFAARMMWPLASPPCNHKYSSWSLRHVSKWLKHSLVVFHYTKLLAYF